MYTDRSTTPPWIVCAFFFLGTTWSLPRTSVKGEGQVQCDGVDGSALGGVLPGAPSHHPSHLWVRTAFQVISHPWHGEVGAFHTRVQKQGQCLLLPPTDLCYTSLSASVVIVLLGSGFTPCEKSWVLTARKQSTGKEIQSATFRCVYLDWLTTQVSRKAGVSRSPDLLHGKHLRCLVCLCMLNGRWMDITPVSVHCALFLVALSCPLLKMSHPEIVYIGFFWFLWFAMLNRCLWAKSSSSEGFHLCALTGVLASACSSSERARPWFDSVFNLETSPRPESHAIT